MRDRGPYVCGLLAVALLVTAPACGERQGPQTPVRISSSSATPRLTGLDALRLWWRSFSPQMDEMDARLGVHIPEDDREAASAVLLADADTARRLVIAIRRAGPAPDPHFVEGTALEVATEEMERAYRAASACRVLCLETDQAVVMAMRSWGAALQRLTAAVTGSTPT